MAFIKNYLPSRKPVEINHIAIWVRDLEVMKDFYLKYFAMTAGEKYANPTKNFTSYFLSFRNGARIELMQKPEIAERPTNEEQIGITHFAISVGSEGKVDELTLQLRSDGFKILGEPRLTGDGYYESLVADPEDNRIEITI